MYKHQITIKVNPEDEYLNINNPDFLWVIGSDVIVSEFENVLTGETWFDFFQDNGEGRPGNLDSTSFRYHGWRGTTNDISEYVHGLRKIKTFEYYYDVFGRERMRIRLGSDLASDKA